MFFILRKIMFKAVVGHSSDPDSKSAIAEIIHQCQSELDGLRPQAGLLFAAIDFDHALILQLRLQFAPKKVGFAARN